MSDRILVVSPASLRDIVMAQGMLQLLRDGQPDAHIAVLAPDWSIPLFRRMPEVNELVRMPLRTGSLNLKLRWQIARSLRGRFDRAIVLPHSLKAALVPCFARIPIRTGFRGAARTALLTDTRPLHSRRRQFSDFAALALPPDEAPVPALLPRPRLRVGAEQRAAVRRELALDLGKPVIALLLESQEGANRRWPSEHFEALAERLVQSGFGVWLFGSDDEGAIARQIVERCGAQDVVDLTGRISIAESIDALSLCIAAVGNDTGATQLAAAVGVPIVAIYGPTSPNDSPPLTPRATVLYRAKPCSPCFKRHCAKRNMACLREIGPDEAFASVVELVQAEH